MTIYALVVGIDAYRGAVTPLRGCVADARAMARLIAEREPGADVRLLLDGDATRAGFQAAISTQLSKAGAGDTAILWFSGHGSQAPSAPGPDAEVDGFDETLVLVDSREPGGRDLLDTELGALLATISAGGAELVVGLDCCHSGSGTRELSDVDTLIRRAASATVPHTRSSAPVSRAATPAGWTIDASHTLLAACRSDQTAKERPIDGVQRGVFSVAVERAVRQSTGAATFRDILALTRTAIDDLDVTDQTPQLEFVGRASPDGAFLSTGLRAHTAFAVVYDASVSSWVLDAGAVHGIPEYVDGTTVFELRRGDAVVGRATPSLVEPRRTLLRILPPEALVRGDVLRGSVLSWALPPLSVRGPADAGELAAAIAASPHLRPDPAADVRIEGERAGFRVLDGDQQLFSVPDPDAVERTVIALERLARRRRIEALRNPVSTPATENVVLEIVGASGARREDEEIILPCAEDGTPRFDIVVRNDGEIAVYCCLLELRASGEIRSALPHDVERLDPGRSTGRRRVRATLPDDLDRRTDVLTLIVSTERFDLHPLLQRAYTDSGDRDEQIGLPPPTTSLEAILRTSQTRDLDFGDEEAVDWATRSIRLTAERVSRGRPLGGVTALAPGISVIAPDGIGGSAKLLSAAVAGRSLDVPLAPPLMLDDASGWSALALSTERGDALDVLELHDVDTRAVTPHSPLLVALDDAVDDHVVVVAFDGVDYLPVGFVDRTAHAATILAEGGSRAGGTVIRITSLPPAIDARGFLGAVKLLFRRLARMVTGRDTTITRLAIATLVDPAGGSSISYRDDAAALEQAVAAHDRILLVVHGIIGDTEGMTLGCFTSDDGEKIVSDGDLVLTFDYESIHTPIEITAASLTDKLIAAGLGPGHGKRVDIVAHSMGGLVSRWMLEQAPAAPEISRLVMAGTPNAGSPIPGTLDILTVWVAFALNSLPEVAWPLRVVGSILGAIEKLDVALDQLDPKSPFLANLRTGSDPGVPYAIVLGDRSLQPWSQADRAPGLARKVMRGAVDFGVNGIFRGEVNDIAVSEVSGRAMDLAAGRTLTPVVLDDIACDHMTYFSHPAGRAALRQALTQPLGPSTSSGTERG